MEDKKITLADARKIAEDNSKFLKTTPPPKPKIKLGRNEKCFCGSGKKYKKCCLGK
jgi:uncharacterized protein YecA (UPF0149 family)